MIFYYVYNPERKTENIYLAFYPLKIKNSSKQSFGFAFHLIGLADFVFEISEIQEL